MTGDSNSHEQAAKPRECVIALLRVTAAYRRRLEHLSAAHGLTYQQYSVLEILRDAQSGGEGPLPTMTVAERMIDHEPGITRMMNRLERKGFVRREASKHDARVSLCRISRKGRAVLRRMEVPMDELYDSLAGSLPPELRQEITRLATS